MGNVFASLPTSPLPYRRVLQPCAGSIYLLLGWALHLAPRGPHYCGGGTDMKEELDFVAETKKKGYEKAKMSKF